MAALVVAGMGAFLAAAVVGLPGPSSDLPGIARDALATALPRWHTTEAVNEVVYGSRGFDTFGETFLLLGAVVGVGAVCRGRERRRAFVGEERLGGREQAEGRRGSPASGRRGRADARRAEEVEQGQAGDEGEAGDAPATGQAGGDGEAGDEGEAGDAPATARSGGAGGGEGIGTRGVVSRQPMTVAVRGGARTVLPVLAVAGAYLVAWGYSPGGGFPAGAVLAGVVLLAYAAYGYRAVRRVVRPDVLEMVELAGAAAIVALEVGGLVARGSFSANWLPLGTAGTIRGGGILQAFSFSELFEVGTGLLLVIFSLVAMEREWTAEDEDDGRGSDGGGGRGAGGRP
ncbi:MAG: MnhB domain-containing protein [Acidimicrobiales bacterium]